MSDEDRKLLLLLANIVAEQLEENASQRGTTNNAADEVRKLSKTIRDRMNSQTPPPPRM